LNYPFATPKRSNLPRHQRGHKRISAAALVRSGKSQGRPSRVEFSTLLAQGQPSRSIRSPALVETLDFEPVKV